MQHQGTLPQTSAAILLPIERVNMDSIVEEEPLILGRLPQFCPEAFMQQVITTTDENEPKRVRKIREIYNILEKPMIPLPHLDPILREKIEKQLCQKMNLNKHLPTIGTISIVNSYR